MSQRLLLFVLLTRFSANCKEKCQLALLFKEAARVRASVSVCVREITTRRELLSSCRGVIVVLFLSLAVHRIPVKSQSPPALGFSRNLWVTHTLTHPTLEWPESLSLRHARTYVRTRACTYRLPSAGGGDGALFESRH